MIGRVTAAVVAAAGGVREASKLGLKGVLLLENSGLIGQNCMHVSAKGLHILCNEDSELLGLIPECIKAISMGEHRVL